MKQQPRFSLLSPSTRAFIKEARRTPHYSLFDWLHGYVYTRWPYFYIGVATGEHPLSGTLARFAPLLERFLLSPSKDGTDGITFADTYHGKVVPLEAATQLVTIEEEITITDLEEIIPYSLARSIVMQNPDHIVALKCPCRAVRPDPCLPLDVCLIIGEPFASFVTEHHPHRSRWITPQEAIDILRAENERGHVHHAFFKDAMMGRFYAICNCCSCCCGAMQAHQNGTPMLASSGYVCKVVSDGCIGCGKCADACPFEAISIHDGISVVDLDSCMGCGVCISKCEQGTLALTRDPARGEPLVMRELFAKVQQVRD